MACIAVVVCGVLAAAGRQMITARAADSGPVGGVVLDGFGGVHPFGGFSLAPGVDPPYWPGWDIARAVQVLPDGSGGWTLDGWGHIHAWGAAPSISTDIGWPGWDIARAFVVLPDHQSGYVLDGWGGIHAFGPDAPTGFLPGYDYWPGWDIARGLDVHLEASGIADGLVILDAWGGLHPIGNYQVQGSPTYYPGHYVYRQIHSDDGLQYTYMDWGIENNLDSELSPYWGGLPSWNGWDVQRDLQLFGSQNPSAQPQPQNPYDWNELQGALGLPSDVGYRPECGIGPSLRYAAAQTIAVSIECQAMTVYQNGQVWMETLVTTGRPTYPTPRGWFHVLWKRSPWWVLMDYPAAYPVREVAYAMAINNNGVLFHDAAWEPASAYGQTSTLTTPYASHGCIHVQRPQLDWLFGWTHVGATVYIN